jgi:hypothetical protein
VVLPVVLPLYVMLNLPAEFLRQVPHILMPMPVSGTYRLGNRLGTYYGIFFGNIYVAFSWSDYFTSFLGRLGMHIPDYLTCSYTEARKAFLIRLRK